MRCLFLVALLLGCSSKPSPTGDGAVPADMTMLPPDFAPRPTAGIACGPMQCTTGAQLCCTTDRGVTGMCLAAPTPSCNGTLFACDAPDDCAPAEHECCVMSGYAGCRPTGYCAMNGGSLMCDTVVDCPPALTCCPAPGGSPYKLCLTSCP